MGSATGMSIFRIGMAWLARGVEMQASMRSRLQATFELQAKDNMRLLPMEGLRGFAVSLVFLQHYMTQSLAIGWSDGLAAGCAGAFRIYGNFGVDLFFVLSGYLIYGTLVHRRPGFGSFMLRRMQRIYPAFLIVFAIVLSISLSIPAFAKLPSDPSAAAVYVLANLALLPGLFPVVPLISVAWSLSYEMFFYLACGVLVLGLGVGSLARTGRLVVIFMLGMAFVATSMMDLPDFPTRMLAFFPGMLLAEGVGRRIPSWLGLIAPVCGFCAVFVLDLTRTGMECIQAGAFFVLCAVCFRGAGLVSRWMSWTPLRWLGNMSYSYYLVHGLVVKAVMEVVARVFTGGLPAGLFWGLLPVLFVMSVAVSAGLFVIVERPYSLTHGRRAAAR